MLDDVRKKVWTEVLRDGRDFIAFLLGVISVSAAWVVLEFENIAVPVGFIAAAFLNLLLLGILFLRKREEFKLEVFKDGVREEGAREAQNQINQWKQEYRQDLKKVFSRLVWGKWDRHTGEISFCLEAVSLFPEERELELESTPLQAKVRVRGVGQEFDVTSEKEVERIELPGRGKGATFVFKGKQAIPDPDAPVLDCEFSVRARGDETSTIWCRARIDVISENP